MTEHIATDKNINNNRYFLVMNRNCQKFDEIYSKPNNATWTYKQIPKELVELIEKRIIIPPCKILEIGCGEGHQSIFLSKKGFEVMAIDRSINAIKFAKQNAISKKSSAEFIVKDLTQIECIKKKFDFIFDWRFLHEITKKSERKKYLKIISTLLKKSGKYLSVAFSGDSDFMGTKKLRTSPAGIRIYFASLKESENLLKKYFRIIDSKWITVFQKPDLAIKANYLLAQKRT